MCKESGMADKSEKVYQSEINNRRPMRRVRVRGNVEKDLRLMGQIMTEAENLDLDREGWRRLTAAGGGGSKSLKMCLFTATLDTFHSTMSLKNVCLECH